MQPAISVEDAAIDQYAMHDSKSADQVSTNFN